MGKKKHSDAEYGNKKAKDVTELLYDYISYRKSSYTDTHVFRIILFVLSCVLVIGLSIGLVIVVLRINDIRMGRVEFVAAIVSVAGTYVTSLFTILSMITKSVFPEKGVEQEAEFIKAVLEATEITIKIPRIDNSSPEGEGVSTGAGHGQET